MIGIFKNNLFFNSLLLLPYAIVLRIHSLVFPLAYEVVETDTLLTKSIYGFVESGFAQNVFATIIIYFQILYINRIVIKHRLANQITLLPGVIYAILVSFLPEYSLLTPFLIANSFVLVAISQIFKIYKRPKAADLLFNVGFLIAFASLLVPNYLVLLLVGLVGLFVLRSLKIIELFQMILGAATVFFAFGSILFLLDIQVIPELAKISLSPKLIIFENRGESLYKIIVVMGLSVFAVLSYGSYTLKKSIQTQKKLDILFWFMIASLFLLFFFNSIEPSQVLLLYISLSILLNFNFLRIKSHLFQEVLHICLLGLLFALNFGLL